MSLSEVNWRQTGRKSLITPVPDFGQDEQKQILAKGKHNLNNKLLQIAGFPCEKKKKGRVNL